jgi:UDP-N-acetylglucosamine:LPS N-acetylglucosamine transferase
VLRFLERLGLRRRFALSGGERRRAPAVDRLRHRAGKIKISGMPVHPKFHEVDEKDAQKARARARTRPEKFTVFVNAGWVGGGNIPQIFRELVRGDLDVQAIFLAGKNEELKREAEELPKPRSFP